MAAALLFLLALGRAGLVVGQEATPRPSPVTVEDGAGIRFPQTAEDHLVVADVYSKKAADYRKEADLHRRMFAAYERLAADLAEQPPPPKRGKTFPPVKRATASKDPVAEYRAHCERYTQGAELLASEADKLAEFHRARARALEEK